MRPAGAALADVDTRTGLRLHVPDRGRPHACPGRAASGSPPRVPGRSRGRLHAASWARSPTPPISPARPASRSCSASSSCRTAIRPAARPGIAFVGDAALASDPFWGIGCGWAFQSAEWLVDETARRCCGRAATSTRALERYRRLHFRRLAPHHAQIVDFAGGRPSRWLERTIWRARRATPRCCARSRRSPAAGRARSPPCARASSPAPPTPPWQAERGRSLRFTAHLARP